MNDLKIFSGTANPALAKRITDYLGVPLGDIALGKFPDGEISCKINEDIRGRDVFLIQPTCPPVNENIMQLLVMIDSCLRASAERITAVIPYFGYARQDRKDEGRVPITAKLVANLITRAGAEPRADDGPARRPDSRLLRRAGRPPVRGAGAQRALPPFRHRSRRTWSSSAPTRAASSGPSATPSGSAARVAIIDKRRTSADTTVQAHILGGAGRRQSRADVRRHDQHRRLDHRGGQSAARARRQGNPRRRHARRACAARRSSGSRRPISPASSSPTRSRSATTKSCRKRRCSPSPRSWAKPSSASTATNRSAGCFGRVCPRDAAFLKRMKKGGLVVGPFESGAR